MRFVLALLALIAVLAAALLGVALVTARSDLLHGAAEMRTAETELQTVKDGRSVLTTLDLARAHVVRARDDFHGARDRLAIPAPLLERLWWVPGVGSQVSAAPGAARMADETAQGVLPLIAGVRPLAATFVHDPPGVARTLPLQTLTQDLAAGAPSFRESCRLFHAAQTARRQLPTSQLPSQVHTLDRQLPRLLAFCQGLQILPDILGVSRPRTYLIAYQNSGELRATGGFIGSASFVTVHNGVPQQQFQGTGFSREVTLGPSPGPMALYNDEFVWLFRDSNWSPDFPTTATVERAFTKLETGRDVDGVINVTPQAASDVLAATGPVYLPEYSQWVSAGNVGQLADYYAHWSPTPGPEAFSNPDTQRKQFIGIVAQRLLSRLEHLPLTQWLQLVHTVGGAVEHRDILASFAIPGEQAFLRDTGSTGAINATSADYLYVVDSNLSYNKINPAIHLDASYAAEVRPNRWVQSTVTLRYRNTVSPNAPTQGYGPGRGQYGGPNDYADFVRIYVPVGAQLSSQSGWLRPWAGGPAYGKTMFCGYIIVRAGQTVTVRLKYLIPPNVFTWSNGARYRLVVQHQPGSAPDAWHVSVRHDGTMSRWTVPHPTLDWQKSVPITHRSFSPIPIPPQHNVVAPGHWIEPHAYFGTGCKQPGECPIP